MSDVNVAEANDTPVIKVPLTDPAPAEEVRAESPLYAAGIGALAGNDAQSAGLVFCEHASLGLMNLRVNPSNQAQMAAVAAVMGMPLPTKPLTSDRQGDVRVRWLSPDEWLVSMPRKNLFDFEQRFRAQVTGHCGLINVSGGMTVWTLSGDRVVDLLKKAMSVDLHSNAFAVGKVVSTLFAKSNAIVCRDGANAFELIVRRSFANYLWLWLQDASREFGLAITTDTR